MTEKETDKAKAGKKQSRQERLAANLRANIQRRKGQSHARRAGKADARVGLMDLDAHQTADDAQDDGTTSE